MYVCITDVEVQHVHHINVFILQWKELNLHAMETIIKCLGRGLIEFANSPLKASISQILLRTEGYLSFPILPGFC